MAERWGEGTRIAWWHPRSLLHLTYKIQRLVTSRFTTRRGLALATLGLFLATPILAPSYERQPPHYGDLKSRCQALRGSEGENQSGCANPGNEKVYISVSLFDPGGHLVNGEWGKSVLELIHLIGDDNVFLSIYENAGGRAEEAALENFENKLRCRHALVHDQDDALLRAIPSIKLPDGSTRLKRIAYLSEIRNRALRPLDTFSQGDMVYDKILFLNDIVFHPIDAAHLLFNTNVGADGKTHYIAACGLDYFTPFLYYDTFALRDVEGYSTGFAMFPIFTTAGHGLSRAAMLAGTDAVPVDSCWGGIVAMKAKYVQHVQKTLPADDFWEIGHHVIDPVSPINATLPVRFRYEPEVFYDACECCLFIADVSQAARGDEDVLVADMGVYMNPYVRVAYTHHVFFWMRWVQRWERLLTIPQYILSKVSGMPYHNPHRAVQGGDTFIEEIWTGEGKHGHWERVERLARNGMFCGERKMLTIKAEGKHAGNSYWESLEIPGGQTLRFG
ncbi:cryptococcal mannosyltransferase 1-domain-containing protein [Jackrogersella minutella]|nr:cryptococcal mannosyltransferase 1-domain-containing protein [Jackrogersella minutella]